MDQFAVAITLALAATPLQADEDRRQLGAHEHGVGHLDIAVEGHRIAIDLRAPGSDIVGFEHASHNSDDRVKVSDAIAVLERPSALFAFMGPADCILDHAHAEYGQSGNEQHHDTHQDQHHAGHFEFHASYGLTCPSVQALEKVDFPYFDVFPAARALEVQLVSDWGVTRSKVTRDMPNFHLRGGM